MIARDFIDKYYDFIGNSDYMSMQNLWSDSSPLKLYIGESHKSVFERFKIRCDILSFDLLYQDDDIIVLRDKVFYQAVLGDGFVSNNTTSLWVLSRTEKLILSNATINVEFLG
ncbi:MULTISPECIES: hypothetical protein [Shewanella]|uniref:hypothetical protein n=1 Tax=Shewanella TaxID=22 RepID=UPI00057B08C0|nr:MULTISPECIES: hypothetical protein [Shewanella]NDO76304.1 hypothetical protein [Shewanella sp. SE1]